MLIYCRIVFLSYSANNFIRLIKLIFYNLYLIPLILLGLKISQKKPLQFGNCSTITENLTALANFISLNYKFLNHINSLFFQKIKLI